MGASVLGLVAELAHLPLSMSSSDTLTDEDPTSIPKEYIAWYIRRTCYPIRSIKVVIFRQKKAHAPQDI
jgi:hypothetical protein